MLFRSRLEAPPGMTGGDRVDQAEVVHHQAFCRPSCLAPQPGDVSGSQRQVRASFDQDGQSHLLLGGEDHVLGMQAGPILVEQRARGRDRRGHELLIRFEVGGARGELFGISAVLHEGNRQRRWAVTGVDSRASRAESANYGIPKSRGACCLENTSQHFCGDKAFTGIDPASSDYAKHEGFVGFGFHERVLRHRYNYAPTV